MEIRWEWLADQLRDAFADSKAAFAAGLSELVVARDNPIYLVAIAEEIADPSMVDDKELILWWAKRRAGLWAGTGYGPAVQAPIAEAGGRA